MIDDVTLWSKLESNFNAFLLILFHRRTILKTLALEQWTESDLLAPGRGRSTAPTPLATGLKVQPILYEQRDDVADRRPRRAWRGGRMVNASVRPLI